jgi:hypothetical protein
VPLDMHAIVFPQGTRFKLRKKECEAALFHGSCLASFGLLLSLCVAFGAFVGLEDFFAQAEGFWGYLYELVFGDELDGLL